MVLIESARARIDLMGAEQDLGSVSATTERAKHECRQCRMTLGIDRFERGTAEQALDFQIAPPKSTPQQSPVIDCGK